MAIGPESRSTDAANVASEERDAADNMEVLPEPADEVEEEWIEEPEEDGSTTPAWLAPAFAALAIVVWSVFFGWVYQAEILDGAPPTRWVEWIVDWSVPVLLVIGLWLLSMRNSRREAARFGATAHLLSRESALLESRLTVVNRELSLAREFIAAQSRDLEALGRIASERLSRNAQELQSLITDNGEQVEAIARVSDTALENMGQLRSELPVISNSARDVSNQIGNVGQVARVQLDELISGMKRLNEFGEASEHQVETLRSKVDAAISAFEEQARALGGLADDRFEALKEQSIAFREELDGHETEAVEALRRRAAALEEELESRRAEIKGSEDEAFETLRSRSTALRQELTLSEKAAVDAMRLRASALEEELEGKRQAIQAAEESALDVLRSRLAQLREEGGRIGRSLRESESDAAEAWSAAVSGLEERMFDAIRKISEVDQQVLDNARKRLDALSSEAARVDAMIVERFEAFEAQLAERNKLAEERETSSLAEIEERFAAFDARITERQEEQLAHVAGLAERGDALADRLTELGSEIERISYLGRKAQDGLTNAAGELAAKLTESRNVLNENTEKVSALTDHSVRLLEIIRAGAKHSGEELPRAIGDAEERLVAFRKQASELRDVIADAGSKSAQLASNVENAQSGGTDALEQITQMEARLGELANRSRNLAEHAREELSSAIALLEEKANGALGQLSEEQAAAIRNIAERIAADSHEAIGSAVSEHAEKALELLQSSASRASEAGRETAIQLRDQLSMVNELAGNLERRVAHARARAEEQVDNDFSRRMALITESLNSNAIDIAKAFDTEVTDTAWSSYLKGDRGIFTRRAVRLLDNQDAKAVAELYGEEQQFRETVNRYIHDFEAMLRSVLSTRDGNALAVTVLSSEIGKLYVALAQAIDRLRN
ncbi:hypothetical protein WYH_00616 [Croceibacterium atlanticum]|uniref:ATPase n=1 Tax=Croceibacterium atlanticum TaxID=1267766 RepID=A0A0F7KR62_9SPHN|nr:hypothetical protein WYH_00616 [Croceibacterium atlanticum]